MFEERRREYFSNLGLSLRDTLKLYKQFGLFEKQTVDGEVKRKHQAPEHMMVVTARSKILGEWLNLSSETMAKLTHAAAMHDAFKAHEHAITKPLGFTWESFEIAEQVETKELQTMGVSQELIDLAHAAGHPLNEAQRKVDLPSPTELEWAWLVIFYVDNYTSGISWASDNPIEERFQRDQQKYTGFNDSAQGKIEGHPAEKGFPALIRLGKEAQAKIATRLSELRNVHIEPMHLPQLIDGEIMKQISSPTTT